MKKILTILASAATLIAFGDGEPINYATFEAAGYTPGEAFSTATNDYGGESTPLYWYTADTDASNVISNYAAEAYDNVNSNNVPIALRPDFVKDNDNSKFLQIETSGRLYRTIKDNEGHGDFLTLNPDNLANHTISVADAPVYLDTLVKFTAADSAFGDDGLENGDKIAISYVEHEAEDDEPYTNFVVRAGRFVGENSTLTNENYFVAVPEGFDKDAWHRLTVRTIADVGDGSVGFVVYLDETILTYSTEFDAGFGTLNPVAKNFYDTTKHALFPSAVGKDKLEGKTISYAAFSGNGSLDDVVFTTTMPNFIKLGEEVVATFTADSGVAGISVKVGAADPIAVDMTAETLTATLPAGTTAFTVTVTLDPNGYGFGDMVYGETSYDNGDEITYNGGVIAITTTRNNFNLFDASGDPISGTFQTLGAVLAASGVAKIQLAYDYTVTDSDIPDGYIDIQQSITLDLNGKTLDGGESVSNPLFMVNNGNFVIIDSVGGGKVVYDGPGIVYGASSYIGAVSGDLGPTFDGKLFFEGGDGYVIRANVLAEGNTNEGAFLWTLGDGGDIDSEANLVGDYWVVTPQGQVGTYTITVTPTENAIYAAVYTDSGDEIEPVNNVYTVVSGKTITITATPAEGYEYATTPTGWTAGANGVITKQVSEAVAIPAPTAKQVPTYELTVPSVTGASAEVTSNGVVVADLTAIPSNTAVVVTWTLTEGYKLTDGSLTENITMDSDKTAATPTVEEITYATLTITQVANCTIVVSNATEEVATGAKFDVADEVQLTVYRTPADGYVLDSCLAVEIIMMNGDQTVTAAVKVSGGSNWPSTWNNGTEPASMTTAFNNWIAVAGNDPTAENAEAAFLVGVNVANYTGAFAAASIKLADGKVVITGNYDLTKINGVLSVKMGNEPNALNTTTVIGELTNGAISLTPALGETKKFYQLVIGYPAN